MVVLSKIKDSVENQGILFALGILNFFERRKWSVELVVFDKLAVLYYELL